MRILSLLRSCALAFACFSSIPMPRVDWNEQNSRYMMCFLPLVGVVVGLCVWLWLWFCDLVSLGENVRAAGVVIVPLLVTGGIHVDGLSDVIDAQASHAPPEKKRSILKDPHVGSFAIIGIAVYVLAYFALACELEHTEYVPLVLGCSYVCTRCLSSMATLVFPKSTSTGMLSFEAKTKSKRGSLAIVALVFFLAAALMLVSAPVQSACALVAAVACLAYTYRLAQSQYGGMSGDLAGYFLQMAEFLMVASIALVPKITALFF